MDYYFTVNCSEIKSFVESMTDDERFFANAYLQHLGRASDPAYQALLAERMGRMDCGKKVTLDQVQRIHHALAAENL